MITNTQKPPHYAVIFTSVLNQSDPEYFSISDQLRKQADKLRGFLGEDSARNDYGISVSYRRDLDTIMLWRKNIEHRLAKIKEKKAFTKTI